MADRNQKTVCVVGLGYIGLPTAAVAARSGYRVLGVDVSEKVVETINRGEIHIEEIELDGLVRGVVERGDLRASTQIEPADYFIIAVPTPFRDDGSHAPDLSFVTQAARDIAGKLKPGDCVILESTSPVGTTGKVRDILADLRPDLTFPGPGSPESDVCVAYCPERVLPGRIIDELVHNSRSIGGLSSQCTTLAKSFYSRFVTGECVSTEANLAEMSKLVENAYRDINIAFANELSMIADRQGLDVWEVIRLANRHPRVNILQPGPGVGGHCIAVDPWFIVHGAPDDAKIIRQARETNDAKMHHVLARARALLADNPDCKAACLGLAFKANIDDFRESPARFVAASLAREFGERVQVVEPYAAQLPAEFDGTGANLVDIDTALEECGILIPLVDHDLFKVIPPEERGDAIVYDTRGIWPDANRP